MRRNKRRNKKPSQPGLKESWDVSFYDSKHSFVWKYGMDLIQLLSPRRGERILDLGCGTGHLTHQIATFGAEVVGIDNDHNMIAEAQRIYPELRFEQADAMRFEFAEKFDAVFSNACLHWIKNPRSVLRSVRRSLKERGRFVAEFGGKGNVEKIVRAMREGRNAIGSPLSRRSPWYFPSLGEYASLLEKQGFCVAYASHFDRPTPLEGGKEGLSNWVQMFAKEYLLGLSSDKQKRLIQRVEKKLLAKCYRDGTWIADYRRIRVVAIKES